MKAIPSLIASSTIGIAASGLVLGKLESQSQETGSIVDAINQNHGPICTSSRPGTSFTNVGSVTDGEYSRTVYKGVRSVPSQISQRRPPLSCVNKPKYPRNRRPSLLKIDTASSHESPTDEDRARESLSSRDSWIRRLSSIPTSQSQHGSTVSSSPNTASFSTCETQKYNKRENIPASLPRNRLIKRIPRNKSASSSDTSNKSWQKFSLRRRPTSSHQRVPFSQESYEDPNRIARNDRKTDPPKHDQNIESQYIWRLFFDFSPARTIMDRASKKLADNDKIKHRVKLSNFQNNDPLIPTLIKPDMVVSSREHILSNPDYLKREISVSSEENNNEETKGVMSSTRSPSRADTTKYPRRSISMQFSSPTSWIPGSGNLTGLRWNLEGKNLHRRASELAPDVRNIATISAHGKPEGDSFTLEHINCQSEPIPTQKITSINDELIMMNRLRSRRSYSPLPSIRRLSTFSIDLARTNSLISPSSTPQEYPEEIISEFIFSPNETSITYNSPVQMTNGHSVESPCLRDSNHPNKLTTETTDRASTLIGSDLDTTGFLWCDEDDTDFQSDTVFDSMRSGATGSTPSPKLPLECVFDEAPPIMDYRLYMKFENYSTSDFDEFILEKPTPSRDEIGAYSSKIHRSVPREQDVPEPTCTNTPFCLDDLSLPTSQSLLPNNKEDGLSFEDDDKGWIWGEPQNNFLRRSSQSIDSCFTIENKISSDLDDLARDEVQGTYRPERPKTNVFDWSEPSHLDKIDINGSPHRPRTAHLQQIMTSRSSRALGRRGPNTLHVRSQSVPVAPDTDACKATSKFGTWGLGSKAISEVWDGDFEFDNVDSNNQFVGVFSKDQRGVHVPEAIKANQENIADHVGQIREVCLLVEDLKRLRALGKAQGLLQGEFQPLWLQADGIIALAAPAEEDEKQEPHIKTQNQTYNRPPLSILNNQHRILRTELRSRGGTSQEPRIAHTESMVTPNIPKQLNDLHGSPKNSINHVHAKSSTEVARKVMESMHQQRSASHTSLLRFAGDSSSKMPFDTTSLKDLVNRATVLSRALSQVVCVADGFELNSKIRPQESSPAFTRVFADPMAVQPDIPLCKHHDSNSNSSGPVNPSLLQNSSQLMHMMAPV